MVCNDEINGVSWSCLNSPVYSHVSVFMNIYLTASRPHAAFPLQNTAGTQQFANTSYELPGVLLPPTNQQLN